MSVDQVVKTWEFWILELWIRSRGSVLVGESHVSKAL